MLLSRALSETTLWPLAVYFLVVLLLVTVMMLISHFLGERHQGRERDQVYESGILTTGDARLRISAKFYLVAMFFVIFDLEAAFIIAWAIAVREVGWAGYLEVLVFIGILMVALIYVWRLGALDWGRTQRSNRTRGRKRAGSEG
jgi:NADH-quinone oxidoreductase subunit A